MPSFLFYVDYHQIQSRFTNHVSLFLFLPNIQQIKSLVSNQAWHKNIIMLLTIWLAIGDILKS